MSWSTSRLLTLSDSASRWAWANWGTPVLLLVLGALYYWSYAKFGIDAEDEGLLLINSESVLNGQWPLADFVPSYSPLLYWGLAGLFKIFGVTALTAKLYTILVLLTTSQLAYYIARQVLPAQWAIIPSLLYLLIPGPWYKAFFIFSLLLAVAGMFLWLQREGWRTACLAGVLAGVAFAIRWEAGALAIFLAMGLGGIRALEAGLAGPLSFRLHKLWSALRFTACFLAGTAFPVLCLVGLYLNSGKLAAAVAVVSSFGTTYPQAYAVFTDDSPWLGFNAHLAFLLALFASTLILTNGLFRLWRSGGRDRAAEAQVLLAASALASITYQWGFWWSGRVLQCYVLVYVVCVLVVIAALRVMPIWFGVAAIGALALVSGITYSSVLKTGFYSGSITTLSEPTVQVAGVPRLGGVRPFSHTADDIRMIVSIVVPNRQNRTMVPMTDAAAIAFLTGLPNPTRYHGLTRMSECEQETAIDTFEHFRPYIVLQRGLWETDPFALPNSLLFAYLHRRYSPKYSGSWYILLDRREDEPADTFEAVGKPKC